MGRQIGIPRAGWEFVDGLYLPHRAAPKRPPAGQSVLYADASGDVHVLEPDGTDTTLGAGGGGKVVQIASAGSTASDATTSASYQDSSLSCAITPLYADSILIIDVTGECNASRVAGSPDQCITWVAIRNETDAVIVQEGVRGHIRGETSSASHADYNDIGLRGRYVVNSTTARTFRLQHKSNVATNIQSDIRGDRTGGVRMTIWETRP